MSALPVQETESVLAELPQPKGPGARLKAARQSRDISLDTVAAQLHLRRDMLIALEEDDYDHLPARVFIVGYMRNYARYIGLPAEAIIQSLDQFLPPETKDKPGLPKVGVDGAEVFKPSQQARKNPFSIVSFILLAGVLAVFFIWKQGYLEDLSTPAEVIENQAPEISPTELKPSLPVPFEQAENHVLAPEADEIVEGPVVDTVIDFETAASETDVTEQVPEETVTEKPDLAITMDTEHQMTDVPAAEITPIPVEDAAPVMTGSSGIVLKLTGKSWVEVRDSTGTFKLNNLYKAGTEKIFAGKPPYRILIGNAAEASLMVNGVAFDLESHSKANVARFTLDPSAL